MNYSDDIITLFQYLLNECFLNGMNVRIVDCGELNELFL